MDGSEVVVMVVIAVIAVVVVVVSGGSVPSLQVKLTNLLLSHGICCLLTFGYLLSHTSEQNALKKKTFCAEKKQALVSKQFVQST